MNAETLGLPQVDPEDAEGQVINTEVIEINGEKYKFEVYGEAEVTRGPLGRFMDLAQQIESEGLDVPPEITAVLRELDQRKE